MIDLSHVHFLAETVTETHPTVVFFNEYFSKAAGVALFILMIPPLWRTWKGPTAIDRILGVNVIGTKTAVLLVIIGSVFGQIGMFVDFALAYALLNFIGALAASRFLHKMPASAGLIEPEAEAQLKKIKQEGTE